ncbi:hypothetical protein PRUPE_7G035100 [Prunus persica]|uniref:protein-tyrosine-phosphatase n=1 Tax=Prunus persica TaxID=3760 RepID=A0A251N8E7_PRUPE|nr:hypothetical protein PRUPE_7G035100 [Prunus persica]
MALDVPEIKKVYAGGSVGGSTSVGDGSKTCLFSDKLSYSLERAGKDLKLERMGVPLRDMDDENLLDYLDVASIITAYLMRTEHLSQEDALGSLRQSYEFVCPNDGFLDQVILLSAKILLFSLIVLQLKMYDEMGFKVDRASPICESYHRGDKIDNSKFGADPGLPSEVASGVKTGQNGGKTGTPAFRCKKCRRIVALQDNVVDHIPGEGGKSFEWRKRKSSNLSEDSECSSIFVEPLRWMTAVEEGALEGKLSCAHFEACLGYFNWSGSQCSCGSWITTAFQLHRSRVDVSTV